MKWTKPKIDPEVVREISKKYGIDLLAAAILVRRGFTHPEDVRYIFETDLRFLHNPFLFEEMSDAVERILQAATEGEKVLVYGDRDVDGVTSTVLMTDTLTNLGIEAQWAVPMGDEAYGLSNAVYDTCAESDTTLLVAVDCGTTNVDEIRYGAELGIDTVVVDHHNPQDERPPAVAIINPKLPDSAYPFPGLCACALVSKVRYALSFSQSDFYNQTVCLMNCRPGNDSLILDVIKMENLIEIDRMSENLVPEVLNVQESRLGDFLLGHQILVYDAPAQERMLRQAFGAGVDIHLIDVASELWRSFPSLKGQSLLRLKARSRLAKYGDNEPSEIDVFASLFETFVQSTERANRDDLRRTLDLVAVATLADMMPMRDENRILVAEGLKVLSESPRGPLRELLDRQKLLGKSLEARDIGWNISPVLNAPGRMGQPEKAVKLLLATDATERASAAEEIIGLNVLRKRNGDAGWELIRGAAGQSLERNGGRFIFTSHDQIHRGVTGILAGRLARAYNAPAAVATTVEGRAVGSIRSARGLVATELLAACDDLLIDWGGHDEAAGFQLKTENLPELEERIRSVVRDLSLHDEEQALPIDAELPAHRLEPALAALVRQLGPYGQEFPPLAFMARNLQLGSLRTIGKNDDHLRLELKSGSYRWPAVYWGGVEKAGDLSPGESVDVVFQMGTNFFQGRETHQLTILDMRRSGTTVLE